MLLILTMFIRLPPSFVRITCIANIRNIQAESAGVLKSDW
jgi:hypothetical protein